MAGYKITWDRYSLKINGKRIFLTSGEFHYWRVPDRKRWKDILRQYRIAGLNAVRIYFHWGYHNPSEGDFIFSGNRDIKYLLELCEELGLYVLAAPGPYICAETSAGGYPLWLVSRRDIRIKHLKGNFRQEYDLEYMKHCREWYEQFIRRIRSHQLTESRHGCVIGFQIENEYLEKIGPFRGSRRYIKELVFIARENGVTVPTFHNDPWEAGSWNRLVNLYGFDKYVNVMMSPANRLPIPPWKISEFRKKTDNLEKTVGAFPKPSSDNPIFLPELQGGWYNHWGVKYGFDDLYDRYGHSYQKLVLESLAAQRATMMNLYMFYGGTNHGSIFNPEVYTSYDYSGCLREFGYQSGRFRYARLFNLFARSFNESFTCTDPLDKPAITCSMKDVLYRQRRSQDGTVFTFFRNFNKSGKENFCVTLPGGIRVPRETDQTLRERESFIAVGQCPLDGFTIKYCSLPVVVRGSYGDGTLLVFYNNGGECLLEGSGFRLSGELESHEEKEFIRISFPKGGFGRVKSLEGKNLYLVCLTEEEALTLNADFSGPEVSAAWGAYSLFFNSAGRLEIETFGRQDIWVLNTRRFPSGFTEVRGCPVPGLRHAVMGKDPEVSPPKLRTWKKIKTDWSHADDPPYWRPIAYGINHDPLDHHFACGHVLYKCVFKPSPGRLMLKLNARHKAAVWVNGRYMGGQSVYHAGMLKRGAMNGPDFRKRGAASYDLSGALREGEEDVLLVLTESLGQSKCFLQINDVRNPRGILTAKFSRRNIKEKWFLAGTDVTLLEEPYNTSGLPGERQWRRGFGYGWEPVDGDPTLSPGDQVVWLKNRFDWNPRPDMRFPLRLHLEGKHNLNIYLNGACIGRYWGERGPQHDFYLMDRILQRGRNELVLGCWTTHEDGLTIEIKPYYIRTDSGNIDEKGRLFATERFIARL